MEIEQIPFSTQIKQEQGAAPQPPPRTPISNVLPPPTSARPKLSSERLSQIRQELLQQGATYQGRRTAPTFDVNNPLVQEYAQSASSRRPYVQPTGKRQSGRKGTRQATFTSLGTDDEAVAAFVANQCGNLDDIIKFIHLVREGGYNGFDMSSIVETAYLASIEPARPPYSGSSRVAGMSLSPTTFGVKPSTQAKELPSLLWDILLRECDSIGDLNVVIEEIMKGDFGFEAGEVKVPINMGTPEEQAAETKQSPFLYQLIQTVPMLILRPL